MNSASPASPSVPVPKVFISYRREEAGGHAGRLYDGMAARFGERNVFIDVGLAPGIDFVNRITEVVGACHVLIVVIGPRWTSVADDEGAPRIADPEDFVRLEVKTALQRDDVTVIPVLVAGARMPDPDALPPELRAITRRNALELSDLRWRDDVARLIVRLEELLADTTAVHQLVDAGAARRVSGSRLVVEGVLVAAIVGLSSAGIADSLFPKGLGDVGQVAKRVATWAPVGIAVGIWLAARGSRSAMREVGFAAVIAMAAATVSGAIQFVPEGASELALGIPAFGALGIGLGAITGALWVPRRPLVGATAGLAAGALGALVIPIGEWSAPLAVCLRAGMMMAFVVPALLAAAAAQARGQPR